MNVRTIFANVNMDFRENSVNQFVEMGCSKEMKNVMMVVKVVVFRAVKGQNHSIDVQLKILYRSQFA